MADKPIDTGTGGFPIDGKAQTYDVGVDSTSPSAATYSPGQVKVDASPKDISQGTKKTLADYLSKTTMGKTPSSGGTRANPYPINHSISDDPGVLALKDSDGYVAPLTNTNSSTQPHFVDVIGGDGRSLKQTSLNVVRGAEKPPKDAKEDGNVLLRSAVTPPAAAPVPPPRGEVNFGTLKTDSPVKAYTEAVIGTTQPKFSATAAVVQKSTPVPADDKGLANYLSKSTKGDLPSSPTPVDNDYVIENGATDSPTTLSIKDSKGYSPQLSGPPSGPHFKDYTPGDQKTPAASSLKLTKGRQEPGTDPNTVSGHKLLSGAAVTKTFTVPSARGTVNVTELKTGTLKDYTVGLLGSPTNFTTAREFGDTWTGSEPTPLSDADQKKYAADVTQGKKSNYTTVPNVYTVGKDPVEVGLLEKGYPQKPTNTTGYFVDYTSGDSRSAKAAGLQMLRGREEKNPSSNAVDGNFLLRNAALPAPASPDPVNIAAILKKNPLVPGGPTPTGADQFLLEPLRYRGIRLTTLSDSSPVKGYTTAATQENYYDSNVKFDSDKQAPVPLRVIHTTPPRDIPKTTRKTLADYLTRTSKGNRFPVTPDTTESSYVKLRQVDNRPVRPTQLNGDDSQTHFSDYDGVPNSLSDDSRVNQTVKNHPPVPERLDGLGHEVLKKELNEGSYSRSLFLNNRFNPTVGSEKSYETYSMEGGFASRFQNSQYAVRYPLGRSLGPEEPRDVSYGKLSQVGTSLTTRASTELLSKGNDPSGGGAAAAAILPGINQLGVAKISQAELEARRILDQMPSMDNIDEDSLLNGVLTSPTRTSWGSLNNVHDQFAGASNFGMQLLSVALVTALATAMALFEGILQLFGGKEAKQLSSYDKEGRRFLGHHGPDSKGLSNSVSESSSFTSLMLAVLTGQVTAGQLFGLQPTSNPYQNCVSVGTLNFFGINTGDEVPGFGSMIGKIFSKGLAAAAQSPGYYSVVARSVNRSFLTVGAAFESLVKSFGVGAVQGISQIFNTFDAIRQSRFLKILNIFAQLGDTILSQIDTKYESGRLVSKVDAQPNIDAASKNRLKGDGNTIKTRLAWSSYRSPDMFLIPRNIQLLLDSKQTDPLGGSVSGHRPETGAGIPTGRKNGGLYEKTENVLDADKSRISTEDRIAMEKELEAEYVPFYFHDIRTNEIVSFHAFLTSLNDDYTASYDSVDGFGRIEPIKTYKSTQRKIGVSFMVAATSPDDFDYMWHKINKLTTMIYPQYTAGRRITSPDGYSIYAPFSQMIQAAPMIRLMVGDLVTSNYSRFSLARLFGFGSSGTKFSKSIIPAGNTQKENKAALDAIKTAYAAKVMQTYLLTAPLEKLSNEPSQQKVKIKFPITLPPGAVVMIEPENKYTTDAFQIVTVIKVQDEIGTLGRELTDAEKKLTAKYFDPKTPTMNLQGKRFLVMTKDLKMTEGTYSEYKKEIGKKKAEIDTAAANQQAARQNEIDNSSKDSENYIKEVVEFMNDTGDKSNAIARSFRSTGGRGLAGFIDSMSFDWFDRTTWEIGSGVDDPKSTVGRRAPKMCKVTISFTPVHDITPGIDHRGYNRAPIYQVGPFRSAKK